MDSKKERLEKSVKLAEYRLKQFDKKALETECGNIAYNRLLVEKATMMQELKELNDNPIKTIAGKCYRKIIGKKLICDSF